MANQEVVPQRRSEGNGASREPNSKNGTSSPNDASPPQQRMPRRTWISFLFILLVNVLLVRTFFPRGEATVKVPYTLFREQVPVHNVQAIYSHGASITGRFIKPVTYPRDTTAGGRPQP